MLNFSRSLTRSPGYGTVDQVEPGRDQAGRRYERPLRLEGEAQETLFLPRHAEPAEDRSTGGGQRQGRGEDEQPEQTNG